MTVSAVKFVCVNINLLAYLLTYLLTYLHMSRDMSKVSETKKWSLSTRRMKLNIVQHVEGNNDMFLQYGVWTLCLV